MSTPPRNTEIWACPCMLYWTTLPGRVGRYPMQSELFFMQLEGFLVSQSRIQVNLSLTMLAASLNCCCTNVVSDFYLD
jgi:hypothetical protein